MNAETSATRSYSPIEEEVLILKANWDSLQSMINHNMLRLSHNDPQSEAIFHTDVHQQLFNILLLDYIHSPYIGSDKLSCLDALLDFYNQPNLGRDACELRTCVQSFNNWLSTDIPREHRIPFSFPRVSEVIRNEEIELKITRKDFIKICGNISKHNTLGLSRQAALLRKIFQNSGIQEISESDALLAMRDFYEHFHRNVFTYHVSTICEFLNNIRWAIYTYLQPIHQNCTEYYWDDIVNRRGWKYNYPANINNSLVKSLFWDLMNDMRSEPCLPRFVVGELLKRRY